MRNKAAFLKRAAPFNAASPNTLKELAAAAEPKRVARRAPLWGWGDRAAAALVRSGIVRESMGWGERPLTLGFFGRGDLVGGEVAFGLPSGGAAEAYEDCTVIELPGDALRAAVESDSALAAAMARLESERRVALQERLAMVAHRTAPQRLASIFLDLGGRFGVKDSRGTIVNIRLTHREMAGLIGATRETVSFAVTDLRRQGFIETDGKRVVLLDRRALTRMAAGQGP